jgi:hypothetical protein
MVRYLKGGFVVCAIFCLFLTVRVDYVRFSDAFIPIVFVREKAEGQFCKDGRVVLTASYARLTCVGEVMKSASNGLQD